MFALSSQGGHHRGDTRVEILSGVERRRVWSDEEKLRILDEIAASGLSVAAIARRHDILPQQIYTWRKRFGGGSDVSAGKLLGFCP